MSLFEVGIAKTLKKMKVFANDSFLPAAPDGQIDGVAAFDKNQLVPL